MGSFTTLAAADGFTFPAYVAQPAGTPRGAVVVVQEIFGVNSHIRAVADGYAAAGYLAVAPATFARVKADVELGYTEADMGEGLWLQDRRRGAAPARRHGRPAGGHRLRRHGERRQGGHRRLLLGRPADLARRLHAQRPGGRCPLLRGWHDRT
jgi:hypothetical protein